MQIAKFSINEQEEWRQERKKPVNLKTAINKNNQILIIERKKIFKKAETQ